MDIRIKADQQDSFTKGISLAIAEAGGVKLAKDEQADLNKTAYRGVDFKRLLKLVANEKGLTIKAGYDNIVDEYNLLNESAKDFYTAVLTSAANLILNKSYFESSASYRKWTGTGWVRDFKSCTPLTTSPFAQLNATPPGTAPTKRNGIMSKFEAVTAKNYSEAIFLTFEALINDDIAFFTSQAGIFGSGAARAVNDAVYRKLISNPLLTTGYALFSENHNNLAANGGAPAASTLEAGVVKICGQKSGDLLLNVLPKYLIVPPSMSISSRKLLQETYGDGAEKIELVVDGLLSESTLPGYDANAWYLTANPNEVGTVTVYTLPGGEFPIIRSANGRVGDAMDITFDVVYPFAVGVDGYVGMFKNDGGE